MKLMYKLLALFAVAVIATTGLLAKSSPAEASLWSQCPTSSFCIFTSYYGEHSDYPYCIFSESQLSVQGLSVSSTCNNKGKSFSNKTRYPITIIDAANCDAHGAGWRRGIAAYTNVNGIGSDWVNRVSSINRSSGNADFCGV